MIFCMKYRFGLTFQDVLLARDLAGMHEIWKEFVHTPNRHGNPQCMDQTMTWCKEKKGCNVFKSLQSAKEMMFLAKQCVLVYCT